MLFHHDNRDYATARSDAARAAKDKLNAIIAAGAKKAQTVLTEVFERQIDDALVPDAVFEFGTHGVNQLTMAAPQQSGPATAMVNVTEHALGQLCQKAGMPTRFAKDLLENKSPIVRGLAAENLETLIRSQAGSQKSLIRSVNGSVHAVLSDKFKRIDSRPMLEAFVMTADKNGLVPVDGFNTHTRTSMRALWPEVFEPYPGEVIAFGIQYGNSDFGAGASAVTAFILRLWCTNTALRETALRQVHTGSRLQEGSFSDRTYELEAQTAMSAMNDTFVRLMAPSHLQTMCNVVKEAAEKTINVDAQLKAFVDKGALTKGEAKAVGDVFKENDVEKLPPCGNSAWRLSNALSWTAKQTEAGDDRRLHLETLAGAVLPSSKAA